MEETSIVACRAPGVPAVGPSWPEPRADGAYVVAFLNRKGGVGKTSCCHHLAGSFAQAGRRVLLVDADPQASLTQGVLGPPLTAGLAIPETLACLFDDAFDPDAGRLIRATSVDGVSLLPASAHLDAHNRPDPES